MELSKVREYCVTASVHQLLDRVDLIDFIVGYHGHDDSLVNEREIAACELNVRYTNGEIEEEILLNSILLNLLLD